MFAHNLNPVKRFKRLTIPILAALIRIVASRARDLHRRHWPPTPVERRDPAAAAAASQTAKETPSPSSSPTAAPLDLNRFVVNLDGVKPIEVEPPGYEPDEAEEADYDGLDDLAFDLELDQQILDETETDERRLDQEQRAWRAEGTWSGSGGCSTSNIDDNNNDDDDDGVGHHLRTRR